MIQSKNYDCVEVIIYSRSSTLKNNFKKSVIWANIRNMIQIKDLPISSGNPRTSFSARFVTLSRSLEFTNSLYCLENERSMNYNYTITEMTKSINQLNTILTNCSHNRLHVGINVGWFWGHIPNKGKNLPIFGNISPKRFNGELFL